jgi:hypothetical protein
VARLGLTALCEPIVAGRGGLWRVMADATGACNLAKSNGAAVVRRQRDVALTRGSFRNHFLFAKGKVES